mmetsp:Transcript_17653/g.57795  ORF Transcript_17653/g.57795 Transcript_17653/m.57795 type:complete len:208 (-) Transcript_17653:15-638(-)
MRETVAALRAASNSRRLFISAARRSGACAEKVAPPSARQSSTMQQNHSARAGSTSGSSRTARRVSRRLRAESVVKTRALASSTAKRQKPRMEKVAWSSSASCNSRCTSATMSSPKRGSAAVSRPHSAPYTGVLGCKPRAQSKMVSVMVMRKVPSWSVRTVTRLCRCECRSTMSPMRTMRLIRRFSVPSSGSSSSRRRLCMAPKPPMT